MADKKEEKKGPLDIPINVPPRDYVISGLGVPEIIKIVICSLIGLSIGIYIYTLTDSIYPCFIVPTITGCLGYVIFRRDNHTENMIDKFGFMIEFRKSQKIYEYQYHNIYEDVELDKGDLDEIESRIK